MAATMSATLSFPFQASMDGPGPVEGYDELNGFDFNMYYEMPSPDLEEEECQSVATFNPRWDSLPSNQELSMMATQRLSMMAAQRETVPQEPALVEDADKEVLLSETSPPLLDVPRAVRLPIPSRPRFYSTPITDDDASTTPVLLYGLEQPSEYAPAPRRRLAAFRPVSFIGGGAAPTSRPLSSYRNQPSSSRTYQSPASREPRSSTPLKRLSTLIENASHQVHSTVSSRAPSGATIEESIASSTSSASTSRSRVTLATVESDGATAPSPPLSGSPASSIRDAPASAEPSKAVIDPHPVPTVARAATSIVDLPSENRSNMPPAPPPKPIRRKTAPDMSSSIESRPSTATTKPRVPASFSSVAKMSLPKLPSLSHRVRENIGTQSPKPTHKSAVPNTTASHILDQSLTRPLPPSPPPHDYTTRSFTPEIQPDDIPSHTNYDQRATATTARSSSSRPTGIRRVTNGDSRTGFWKPSNNQSHQEQSQSQSQSQSQRGRGHRRPEQTTRAKSSSRITRVFSQFGT
ncbi:hypothetical protein PISL3812_03130 [Talaromyces islandicus]|uniref:Uncharacterized protein n=1 Tax=Talaromyces islandicus TaxID=28573 RepID=A0A0U1LRU7_TALIS|nr:hypothetical protein PISL3812_03130 [Talaromyces islandicus]